MKMKTFIVAGPNVRHNGVTLRKSESPPAKSVTLKFKSPQATKNSSIYFLNTNGQKKEYFRQKEFDSMLVTFNSVKKMQNP